MQKKSLLVALFCGALCLTGCLKNEESASVTQVRLAKAEELKSLAALNTATAEAKLIYANAEKTLKQAEAKLIEAQAALVNAQAETEKVRAELLKVQVQLANVLVEEEKVKLKMMEADLEARLAALEVEKAAADAAKQAWANVLNDLVAQAQIDAINNSKKILEAEENLADYVLTIEGQKADSAKYYAGLYFESLKEIEALQVEELEWKATQVLVNQGAILARDAIHEMIKKNNEEIAENNAIIAALKEHQSKTPEEAEAELKAAREAMEAAYTNYQDALKAEQTAQNTLADLNDDVADFVQGWDSWKWDVKAKMPHAAYVQKFVEVEVGENTVIVPTVGINVKTDAGVEFVPFFNAEATDVVNSRYPNVTVYEKDHSDHRHLTSTVIAPATIEFDNIKEALDKSIEHQEAIAEKNIAARAAVNEWTAGQYEKQIEALEEKIDLHEDYVAVRQEAVEAAEQAYIAVLAKAEQAEEEEVAAWVEFQEYMLLSYPTVSSKLFIDRLEKQQAYDKAKAAETSALNQLQLLTQQLEALKEEVKPLFEEYAKSWGQYKSVKEAIEKNIWEFDYYDWWTRRTIHVEIPSETKAAYDAWKQSMTVWSPDFADATEEPVYDEAKGVWKKGDIEAGTSQNAVLTANFVLERAKELEYAAYIDYLSGAKTEAQYNQAKQEVVRCQNELAAASTRQDNAWLDYVAKYNRISELLGIFVNEIEKYFKEGFQVFDYVVFPTDALYDPEGKVDYEVRETVLVKVGEKYVEYPVIDANGNWCFDAETWPGSVPGLAQRDLLDAVKAVVDKRNAIKDPEKGAQKKYDDAEDKREEAEEALNTANTDLIKALGGDPKKGIEPYLDEQAEALYKTYLAKAKVVVDVNTVYTKLEDAYKAYPDHIGAPVNNLPQSNPQNFGWLISNYEVNYKATYLGKDGKEHLIAKYLYPNAINPFAYSMQYQVEMAQNMIDVVLPAQFAAYEKAQNNNVKAFKASVASILEKIDAYKPLESQYDTWVDNRNAADKAYNQAKMDTYDAAMAYIAAKADYKAADAVVKEGVWVYDPKKKLDGKHQDGFTKVNIAKAIEHLEAQNEELEAENEFYRNVLNDGETVLATVNQILDEKIQTISDNIKILTAISAQYKAIMNTYLGIVEE